MDRVAAIFEESRARARSLQVHRETRDVQAWRGEAPASFLSPCSQRRPMPLNERFFHLVVIHRDRHSESSVEPT